MPIYMTELLQCSRAESPWTYARSLFSNQMFLGIFSAYSLLVLPCSHGHRSVQVSGLQRGHISNLSFADMYSSLGPLKPTPDCH